MGPDMSKMPSDGLRHYVGRLESIVSRCDLVV